eukprot:TRINITY_DN27364_c0_g3_i1.p1 TRINITY_DN27364_c0_g3~~TRINITY_DN27364_c0_g3_i1.p1  ORF type:complete len:411 (-),score=86.85 TRINITY_DN27364_c0_g3_i1:56-1114(-)
MSQPTFKADLFTDFGKWMDGWESRRRRTPGHDWCIVELGAPGIIQGVEVDTAFFTGNNVPALSIQVCSAPGFAMPADLVCRSSGEGGIAATEEELQRAEEALNALSWHELLPQSVLKPGYESTRHNFFACSSKTAVTHLRVNTYPDGGIARLRVFGEVLRDWNIVKADAVEDFALSRNGAVALAWSNAHYGLPRNCLAPGASRRMDEGWETARNPKRPAVLQPGPDGLCDCGYAFDWFIMRLGARCLLNELELDTSHFKGNFPESCLVEGLDDASLAAQPALEQMKYFAGPEASTRQWLPVLPRSRLGPHQAHTFNLESSRPVTHLRITIFPDGGIARVRARGCLRLERPKL